MKNGLWKRIKYYLIGFTIGLIFITFFFKDSGCSWMPSNRIKNSFLDKVIVFPDAEIDKLAAIGITDSTVYDFILHADINYSESVKEQGVFPKAYVLEVDDSIDQRVQFSIYQDSYVTIVHALEKEEKSQRYKKLDGWGEMMRLPKDSSMVYVDKSNFTQCKMRGLNNTEMQDITMDLKHSGRIDFSKSDLMLPKAEQYISFIQDDTLTVEAKTIWYESRITFKDFIWEYKLPCEEE